jgi:hypothetical protein
MVKKILLFLLVVGCFACNKNKHQKSNCSIDFCTEEFASINIRYVDKAGKNAGVKDFTVTNLRTNKVIDVQPSVPPGSPSGYKTVATDNNIKEFSSEGDDVSVAATDSLTLQTKATIMKIVGGECACHIIKKTGPDKVAFD